jgi:hypothetical protein
VGALHTHLLNRFWGGRTADVPHDPVMTGGDEVHPDPDPGYRRRTATTITFAGNRNPANRRRP